MFDVLTISWRELRENFVFERLYREDEEVEGSGWSRWRNDSLHEFLNCLRIISIFIVAPFYLLIPHKVVESLTNYFVASWSIEFPTTPDAILDSAPGGGSAVYDVSHERPSWMLEVKINNQVGTYRQVPWTKDIWNQKYVALSYPFKSAEVLFLEENDDLPLQSPETTRRYSNSDRQHIAAYVLSKYIAARAIIGRNRIEYVWMDEFCLSDSRVLQATADEERKKELGRLAEIFRGATMVCVFCDVEDCDHTGMTCPWGTRLFTLAEILHADRIVKMTRRKMGDQLQVGLEPEQAGRFFRERIQANAAVAKHWHLYAIMQQASNSGTVSWQVAIHALIVEVLRRDQAGGFTEHRFLGKSLNGLLPRRARLIDLRGNDGWADLIWLLELNQGFYNAASLAAVCSLPETNIPGQCWLGSPIAPREGNERLEPLVTAFPVPTGLNILRPTALGLRPNLKRNGAGLYQNPELHGLKLVALFTLLVLIVAGLVALTRSIGAGVFLIYLGCIQFCFADLVGGSMYLLRTGWIFLDDAQWINDRPGSKLHTIEDWLGHRDSHFKHLEHWGNRQLVPKWTPPTRQPSHNATIVDLEHKVFVNTIVLDSPDPNTRSANAIIPLAVHGCAITCLLVRRNGASGHRVGMVSMPPYILIQGKESATLQVGAELAAGAT